MNVNKTIAKAVASMEEGHLDGKVRHDIITRITSVGLLLPDYRFRNTWGAIETSCKDNVLLNVQEDIWQQMRP